MRSVLDLSDTTVVARSELGMPTKLSLWFAGSYNLLEINLTPIPERTDEEWRSCGKIESVALRKVFGFE
jgi:hypothetical protein